jgi:hypothetical protein
MPFNPVSSPPPPPSPFSVPFLLAFSNVHARWHFSVAYTASRA